MYSKKSVINSVLTYILFSTCNQANKKVIERVKV